MRAKLSKGLFTALLVLGLLLPGIPIVAQDPADMAQMLATTSEARFDEAQIEDVYRVTLVTGDVVIVVERPDGQKEYAISPAEPYNTGQHFLTIQLHDDTYIIPDGVDLQRLDMELFNIDYLVDEEYYTEASLPLLVSYSSVLRDPEVQSLAKEISALAQETKLLDGVHTVATRLALDDISASYDALMKRPEVEKVWLDKKVHASLMESVPLVNANWWWDTTGNKGEGVQIAILDTGIDSSHPALDNFPGTNDTKVIVNVNFSDDHTYEDLYGHGTHCAGIAAGSPEPPSEGSATAISPTSLIAGTQSSPIAGSDEDSLEPNQTQSSSQYYPCSPCGSMPSESSMNTDWSTKPVIVNIQVNLESEEDEKYIDEILSEVEAHSWITSVFVTGEFASEHPEVVSEIEKRGHYIGVHGWNSDDDLSLLGYSDQIELMSKSISAVGSAVMNPRYVVDFKPQNLKYNDDTIEALQELGVKSITATFSADESFVKCPYAKSVGKVTFPYPITTDFVAVPISDVTVGSEEVLLDDDEVFGRIAPTDYLGYLEGELDEHNETKDPMVMVISPSVTGADATKLHVFSQFLGYIEEKGGKVKPTAPITVLQTYIPSLDIVSAPENACAGETITVTTQFSAAIYCPSYYFRIYGKYPSEQEWTLHAEHYHGVQTGIFSFDRSFAIPEPPAVSRGILSPEQIASLIVNRIDDNTAATMVAIAIAESSGNSEAQGDHYGGEYSCDDYTSIGLWQIHMPAHYDKLERHTGSDDPCVWAEWLKNPDSNADVALEILSTQGLSAWSTYNSGAYEAYLSTAEDAVENAKSYTIRVVGQGCAGTCWPTPDSYERMDEITVNIVEAPRIEEIVITPTNPMTTQDVTLEARITDAPGYEIEQVTWVVVLTYYCLILSDNPATFEPPAGTHGDRQVICGVLYRNTATGATGTASKTRDFKLFFDKTGDEDGDGVDNWFHYWSSSDDSVNTYDRTSPAYIYMGGSYGGSQFGAYDGNVANPHYRIWNRASMSCAYDYVIPGYDFNNMGQGCDCVEATLVHERTHQWVDANWHGQPDADGDELPDVWEDDHSTLGFDRNNSNSFPGFPFGDDEEVYCEMQGFGQAGTHTNDWANPGKQSSPSYKRIIVESGTAATLTDVYTDYGRDTNENGFYDYLSIDVGVNVAATGTYTVFGNLYDSKGNMLWAENQTYLDVGNQSVVLNFNGLEIYQHRADGPYVLQDVTLFGFNITDEMQNPYDTSAYGYTDFERHEAWFTNNYSDHGTDTDEDGLYNQLTLELELDVTLAGDYTVEGWLYDNTGNPVMHASNSAYLDIGEQSIEFLFDGLTLHRDGVDGPYSLRYLRLYDGEGTQVDFVYDAYNSSAYSYADFQVPSALLTDTYSDYGLDTNGDGLYEWLAIDVAVNVATPGNYTITGWLSGSEIAWTSTTAYLDAGEPLVTLNFDGTAIYDHGIDGPYDLSHLTIYDGNGATADYHSYAYTTSPYTYTQFYRGGILAGTVIDYNENPVPDACILAIGPTPTSTITDINGTYNITGLQSGDYTIRVEPLDPNLMTTSSYVYLAPAESIVRDFTLQAAGSIGGTITAGNGTGVPNVVVYLSGYETPRYRTDENGNYVIPRLQAGTYTVNVDGSEMGYAHARETVDVTLGNTTIADFILQEPYYQGVAPGAWLWNVKVLDQWGDGYESWIIDGIDYASLGPDQVPGTGDEADVISMSLGWGPTDGTDPLSQAVNLAVDRGIIVVVAAGNWGPDTFTINAPGVAEKAITVGASDKDDNLAYFSSCGPTIDWRVKPDILAPGVDIISSVPGGGYEPSSGTSMATPHVAGAAALLLQQYGTDTPPQFIKDALTYTATDLGYSIYQQGGGRLDLGWELWPMVGVTPANLSMGIVTSETTLSDELTFFNDDASSHNVTLTASLIDSMTWDDYSGNVTLDPASFTIPAQGEVVVTLDVDLAGLPHSIFEGKVTATIDEGASRTVHTIFGFAQMSEVTIHKTDINGEPAQEHYVVALIESPTQEMFYVEGTTNESGDFTFYSIDGTYTVISPNDDATIVTIQEDVIVAGDTTINLDERETLVIDFDPNSEVEQIPAAKSAILYHDYWGSFEVSWWYPTSFVTRVSPISTFDASFTYNCYPSEDFVPDDPDLVNTSEWYNLRYPLTEIAGNITFVADHENLVHRNTAYCTALEGERAWCRQRSYDDIVWSSTSFWYAIDAPQQRWEWLSPPPVYYRQYYEKDAYEPGNCWEFYSETLSYPSGECEWAIGCHPLISGVDIEVGWGWLDIWGPLFRDSHNSEFYNWCAEAAPGYIRVTQDGDVVFEDDIWDWVYWWAYFEGTPHFNVEIWGETPFALSGYSYTRFDFIAAEDQDSHPPRLIGLRVPGMDLSGVTPGGEVEVLIGLVDESLIPGVELHYSLDNGDTWSDAGAPVVEEGWYVFNLGWLSDTFVSLAVDASDSQGNHLGYDVYRGFYVAPILGNMAIIDFTNELDVDDAAGGSVGILEVQDPGTGDPLEVLVGAYNAEFYYDDGVINVLDVRLTPPFDTGAVNINNPGGVTRFNGLCVEGALAPVDLAFLALRLVGSVHDQSQGTLVFTEVFDIEAEPLTPSPAEISHDLRRGDARSDGEVNIADALYIAQYLADLRDLGEGLDKVHPVNAASVKWDSDIDLVDIADVLYICQYLVDLRDPYMNPIP